MKRTAIAIAAASAAAMWVTGASALVEVQARGGWASSLEEFPYAREFEEGPGVFADYGDGTFGEVDVAADILGFGFEVGADFALLDENADFGGPLDSSCSGGVETFLGLIDDCQDAAFVEADTQVITADALFKKSFLGLEFGFGATGLFLDSELDAEYLFPLGLENFVDRDTSLDAYGVKAGLEHSLPIVNTGFTLNTEVYGSWVWGERTVDINDLETDLGVFSQEQFARFEEDIDVPGIDAAVSIGYEFSSIVSLEVGAKYRKLFGAMFTVDTAEGSGVGSDSADLDYWAVFGGLTFKL